VGREGRKEHEDDNKEVYFHWWIYRSLSSKHDITFWEFSYFATKDRLEVDLVIDRPGLPLVFIEIKSSVKVNDEHFRHLLKVKKDLPKAEYFLLSQDPINRVSQGIQCLHWQEGLSVLGL
jgi:predicted AAA+ superfamily ATPase